MQEYFSVGRVNKRVQYDAFFMFSADIISCNAGTVTLYPDLGAIPGRSPDPDVNPNPSTRASN